MGTDRTQSSYFISPARPDDLDELARLINSAYRGDSSRAGWTTEADFLGGQRTDPASLAKQLAAGPSRAILCLRDAPQGPIIGCVYVALSTESSSGASSGASCYLGMLTIQPTLQDRGLGRILLTAAEEWAKKRGAKTMRLDVIQLRDTLMAWYERRGYRRTPNTHPFPYGDPLAGAPLREDLHFIEFEKSLC